MGYNKERGDSLKVTNSAFTAGEVEKIVEPPLWKQPDTIAMAKEIGRYLLIASLLLFLVLKVLRPMLAILSEVRPTELSHSDGSGSGSGSGGDEQEPVQHQLSHADNLEAARQLARSEPKLVASVVKEWVNKDG
jgi:flagellar M-ring protein FliF